ncbi:hypothetical protein MST22_17205 [Virgibacillus halodenitrificans]|uniref:Uncharacterized protein n=1 Tax=Virgibacillus halodenitrificans TaxID=1482 RepID=A0ABR7VTI3_VIRHA|nr:hypothetical protein [Virgibacillus halodenitrificans]MBD1224585.1 hypothetical protein [Virgibacillus halodenitrificans]MCJ0932891.1 hypothetical protein [Virgibacillus halodenitrificans]MYL56910.1 hypothetical protein [Virgibacillus halodenitrificans]WHX26691.1 hypothetical protein QNH47_02205 [Virgibacillus halodenitrificans]
MDTFAQAPICPKCKTRQTYIIDPDNRSIQAFPPKNKKNEQFEPFIKGNKEYYCMGCGNIWTKYEGRKPYQKIKSIYAYIGGYSGPGFQIRVNIEQKKLSYTSFLFNDNVDKEHRKIPSDYEIKAFLSELYECSFLNWADRYDDFCVLDGTSWRIEIELDTHCDIKLGSNHYPDTWKKFCKAVANLSGREFY